MVGIEYDSDPGKHILISIIVLMHIHDLCRFIQNDHKLSVVVEETVGGWLVMGLVRLECETRLDVQNETSYVS